MWKCEDVMMRKWENGEIGRWGNHRAQGEVGRRWWKGGRDDIALYRTVGVRKCEDAEMEGWGDVMM